MYEIFYKINKFKDTPNLFKTMLILDRQIGIKYQTDISSDTVLSCKGIFISTHVIENATSHYSYKAHFDPPIDKFIIHVNTVLDTIYFSLFPLTGYL